ncbi:toprim domain-containing protein [Sphingobacterium detergens]|uniref:CHC2-type zinc finger protein n=1 Tax=Sphingobacterium detergens TaxID=1145106 RepID=A0A420ARP3_SPHD1|nr:toprim domain-containing protein [Sphingobacterium detergens]RKE47138.1 CHC2-type zinc finger protein [Sphingobacterium detergens]
MRSARRRITCAQVNEMDLVVYLETLGYKPQKIKGCNYWYLSPLRIEQTASFKINQQLNQWYDFGIGKGGGVIDFAMLYFNCSVKALLHSFEGTGLITPIEKSFIPPPESRIEITATEPLYLFPLISYLDKRGIDLNLAATYCQQVRYTINGKIFFGIGFKNNSGGFEIRNVFFKCSSSPKDIKLFRNGYATLSVFEGFLDFLSFLKLFDGTVAAQTDYLILNSLSFFEKHLDFMKTYSKVFLYLDNDKAGKSATDIALKTGPAFISYSGIYHAYKDLNDLLIGCPLPTMQSPSDEQGKT